MSTKAQRVSGLAVLPTLMTLCNGLCGLASIFLSTEVDGTIAPDRALFVAGALIFLGMLFDALDGQVARLTGQTSKFGAELDSLCDMITFGVAPVFIMLSLSDALNDRLLLGIGAWYAACTALRLARFNVEQTGEETSHGLFSGLPSPAAAGTVASFAVAMPALHELRFAAAGETTRLMAERLEQYSVLFLPIVTLIVAFLMVSRVPYPHIVHFFKGRRTFSQVVEIVFALVLVIMVHELALPLLFCCFVLLPPTTVLFASLFARHWQVKLADDGEVWPVEDDL